MSEDDYLDSMRALAQELHAGQTRRFTGEPYYMHPWRVADIVARSGGTTDQIAAAYLHDTIEDVGITASDLIDLGVRSETVVLVSEMTRGDESYQAFVTRLADRPCTWLLKRGDVVDNLSTTPPGHSLWKKQLAALVILDARARLWAPGTANEIPRESGQQGKTLLT